MGQVDGVCDRDKGEAVSEARMISGPHKVALVDDEGAPEEIERSEERRDRGGSPHATPWRTSPPGASAPA